MATYFKQNALEALGERLQPDTDKNIVSHEGVAAVRSALAQRGFTVTVTLNAEGARVRIANNYGSMEHRAETERRATLKAALEAMKAGWLESNT